jgi:hypothetical protein
MALTRKTVVDQIEIRRDGSTNIRFGLLILDGDEEIQTSWHRTSVPAGGNVDTQIAAVESHLETMGHPAIETADKTRAKAAIAAVRSSR